MRCPHRTRGGRSYCVKCRVDDDSRHAQRVADIERIAQLRAHPSFDALLSSLDFLHMNRGGDERDALTMLLQLLRGA
jgi:hypothetical protein